MRRPAATSSCSASISAPSTATRKSPSCVDPVDGDAGADVEALGDQRVVHAPRGLGLLAPRSRSATSSSVTRLPKRAKACASSAPIAPPPTTTSRAGASVACTASRLVQYGVAPARRSAAPRARCRRRGRRRGRPGRSAARPGSRRSPRPGPARRPWPRTIATPGPPRSLGLRVVVPVVGDLPDPGADRCQGRAAGTGAGTGEVPGRRGPRPGRAPPGSSASRACTPKKGHSPPTSRRSTPTTRSPAAASFRAASWPPEPSPTPPRPRRRPRTAPWPSPCQGRSRAGQATGPACRAQRDRWRARAKQNSP